MIYIVCTSGFHKEIAKKIANKVQANILYLPKEATGLTKYLNTLNAFWKLLKCLSNKNSHAIVPHPYNIWFSLFIAATKNRSFYDDGIAYYYHSELPQTFPTKFYNIVISLKKIKLRNISSKTYPELIGNIKYEKFYCLFPELIREIPRKEAITIQARPNTQSSQATQAIYIDSTTSTINKLDSNFIINHLKTLRNQQTNIFFKPHPSQTSEISERLRSTNWAVEINCNLEEFINKNPIKSIYSAYSSATITTKLISPETKLYCYTSPELDKQLSKIKSIYRNLNVTFINTKQH